jgi:hypothetical protein
MLTRLDQEVFKIVHSPKQQLNLKRHNAAVSAVSEQPILKFKIAGSFVIITTQSLHNAAQPTSTPKPL